MQNRVGQMLINETNVTVWMSVVCILLEKIKKLQILVRERPEQVDLSVMVSLMLGFRNLKRWLTVQDQMLYCL